MHRDAPLQVIDKSNQNLVNIFKKLSLNFFMDRISVNSQIHFGKPCIVGTRITVQNVLELLKEGLSFDAIVNDYYPDLEIEDIQACLQYAISLIAAEDTNLISA